MPTELSNVANRQSNPRRGIEPRRWLRGDANYALSCVSLLTILIYRGLAYVGRAPNDKSGSRLTCLATWPTLAWVFQRHTRCCFGHGLFGTRVRIVLRTSRRCCTEMDGSVSRLGSSYPSIEHQQQQQQNDRATRPQVLVCSDGPRQGGEIKLSSQRQRSPARWSDGVLKDPVTLF